MIPILASTNMSQVKRETEYFFGAEALMPTDNASGEQTTPPDDTPPTNE